MQLVYNLSEIQELLMDFHHLTQFRIALFDEHFSELLAYPTRLSDYCKLIRSCPELNTACNRCDYHAFLKCQKTKAPVIYPCHAGLTEIIIPIQSSNVIIGYIMSGQLRNQGDSPLWEDLLPQFSDYPLPLEDLKQAYYLCPELPEATINSAMRILHLCASYLKQCNKISSKKNTLAYAIDSYILENITEVIDIPTLCDYFGYKKTHFYHVTNDLFGMSVMQHIKQVRIHQAKRLLSQTTLSISEVAESVGIYDYNYFSKLFKTEAKCSPREFRRSSFSQFNETGSIDLG